MKKANKQDAKIDAKLLAEEVLEYSNLDIILNSDIIVDQKDIEKYNKYIKLRSSGVPLQYITKKQEFMGLPFNVEQGVLIPRQDTETLIETIIDYSKTSTIYKIVEVGVGSACISISLAKFLENVSIDGIEISEKALKIARKNVKMNSVESQVKLMHGDLLKDYKPSKQVDLVVSNPPYIETDEYNKLKKELIYHEPKLALHGGNDGLRFYRNITKQSLEILRKDGIIAYEIGYNQAKAVKEILISNGFKDIKIIQDLAKKDRVVMGRLS